MADGVKPCWAVRKCKSDAIVRTHASFDEAIRHLILVGAGEWNYSPESRLIFLGEYYLERLAPGVRGLPPRGEGACPVA